VAEHYSERGHYHPGYRIASKSGGAPNCQGAFARVEQQRQRTSTNARNTGNICRANIAASCTTDISTPCAPRNQITEWR